MIVAVATPPGRGALAVVRLTGAGCAEVVRGFARLRSSAPLVAGRARRVDLFDAEGVFDDGLLLAGDGPRTETGEDYAEIGCHGNPLVVDRLVAAALACGARLAGAGEFTRRAWLHGKLDLIGAEAVLQVAEATSDGGLRIARDAAEGRVAARIEELRRPLLDAAAELEARLDYPADDLALEEDAKLVGGLLSAAAACRELADTEAAGRVLVHGARVALVGAVNAGKSSLFNALLGRRRALVHDSPGTTRDVLEVAGAVDGLAVTWLDTAGERPTEDPVEAAGQALARELLAEADLLVVVLRARPGGPDPTEQAILDRTRGERRVVAWNGVDAPDAPPPPPGAHPTVAITGEGVPALAAAVRAALVGEATRAEGLVIASARQRDLLRAAAEAVEEAVAALPVAGPAVAADAVARALEELDALTGADTREDVLDALFARFCIGK